MTANDKQEFWALLKATFELYSKPVPSKTMAMMYWGVLEQYDMAAVRYALNAWMHNPDEGKFYPKPGDLVKMIEGSTEDAAMRAWSSVARAIRTVGGYASVCFDDGTVHKVIDEMGGWIHLTETPTDEDLKFRGHEFVRRYRAYKLAGGAKEFPQYLIGVTEGTNRGRGVQARESVTMIGDAGRCEQVMRAGAGHGGLKITKASGDLVASAIGYIASNSTNGLGHHQK